MILLGGVEQAAEHAAESAEGMLATIVEFCEHKSHELENGDVMTWVAFIAMLLLIALFVVGVGVYRGSITFAWGRK